MTHQSAVLIIHFRDNKETLECLDSLHQAYEHTPFTTYVLSVQSKQDGFLDKHPLPLQIIRTEKNGGFAWANNEMMKQAFQDGHEFVILLNNDTTVDPKFLKPLIAQAKRKDVGQVCPKIYFYPGNEFHRKDYNDSERGKVIWYAGGVMDWANVFASHWGVDEVDHGQFDEVCDTDFATGCCVATSRKAIEKYGFMDEKYFLYYEDADWSLAAKSKGLRVIYEPKSVIWHKNAGSTGGSGSSLQMYYQTRNRVYFGLKFAPLKTKLHLLKNQLLDLKSLDPSKRKGALDMFKFHLGQQATQ